MRRVHAYGQEGSHIEGEELQRQFKVQLKWARVAALGDAKERNTPSGVVIYREEGFLWSSDSIERSLVSTTITGGPSGHTAFDPNARYLTGSMNDVSLFKGIEAIVIAFPSSKRYKPGGIVKTAQFLADRANVPVYFRYKGEADCVSPK